MLNMEELRELAEIRGNGAYYVSFYLNVNPVTNPRGDHLIYSKNMVKSITEALDKSVLKKVRADIEKIEAHIMGNKRRFKKGVSLIASGEAGIWKEYYLNVPLKNELIVDKTPYIKPLFDVLNNYKRYGVLLVDKESARIFALHLGEMAEFGEVHTPDIPGKHKKGGWFALSQNHYERHTAYHVGMHIKEVLKRLEHFLSREAIERLVIGGSDDAISMAKDMLHKTVTEKIIGTFQAGMSFNTRELLDRIQPVIQGFEKQDTENTVKELIKRAAKDEKAVAGIDDVLRALQEKSIQRLVFLSDLKHKGQACVSCRHLTSRVTGLCPYCKGRMENIDYLIDLAAQKAVEQGAVIEVVPDNKSLLDSGGIGAFLRF